MILLPSPPLSKSPIPAIARCCYPIAVGTVTLPTLQASANTSRASLVVEVETKMWSGGAGGQTSVCANLQARPALDAAPGAQSSLACQKRMTRRHARRLARREA